MSLLSLWLQSSGAFEMASRRIGIFRFGSKMLLCLGRGIDRRDAYAAGAEQCVCVRVCLCVFNVCQS